MPTGMRRSAGSAKKWFSVIDDYAQQNGLVLVIDGAQIPVYYAAKDIDLTAEIVKRYDAANPVAGAETSPKPGARPPAASSPAKPK